MKFARQYPTRTCPQPPAASRRVPRSPARGGGPGWGLLLALAIALASHCAIADTIKIGMQKLEGLGPIFVAQERGYFAAEGVPAELVYFQAAPPVAVGVVSGDLDFGIAGISGGFYSLAAQGALRIIAGYIREAPSFKATAYVVSNRAWAAGMRSLKDFPGHSVGVIQVGTSQHYALGLLAEKYGFDLKSIRVVPLQTGNNEATALVGGQIDAALIPITYIKPALEDGGAKLLGWVGDETPWQLGVVFTATRTANEKRGTVERFLRAYRHGVRDFYDAFIGPDGRRRDGPTAPEITAIISKYVGSSPAAVRAAISYYDRDARLDVQDILHQIAWFKAQGLLKGELDGATLIDRRYVVPLPER